MNYAEQITAFENKRAANLGTMKSIMDAAANEGATLDAAQQEEFDGLEADNVAIDSHLKRLRAVERAAGAASTPISGGASSDGSAARGGQIVVKTQPKLAPGIEFARLAKCYGMAKGVMGEAIRIAEGNYGENANVVGALKALPALDSARVNKASVAGGSTTNWAGALVGDEGSAFADFVEFLRPLTILGRFGVGGVPALRTVPFRVPLVAQTAGGAGYWVGEGKAKPLTAFDFTRTTLGPLKVANIAVLTEEVIRDSSPAAEQIVRDELANALRARLDTDFIDPSKAAVADISPASITNGAATAASRGNDADSVRADVQTLMATYIAANLAPSTGVWIMSTTNALALSMMVNALGQPEFPGITMQGGTFFGLPVIVSEFVGSIVALVNASDIYLADDGDIAVDLSREASLVMADNPTMDSTTPTAAQMVSMFQTNSVAFRAERTINWARRRAASVAYLTGVTWGAPEPVTP